MATQKKKLLGVPAEIEPVKHQQPVFVIGLMRSGTTFLVDKLSSHPQLLKIGNECSDAWHQLADAPIRGECSFCDASHYKPSHTYNMTRYFDDFIAESKGVKRHLARLKLYYQRKLGRVFYDWDNVIPLNKSTHLVNKIEFVRAVFPESKIIYIIRDVYGQVASMKQHFFNESGKGSVHQLPNKANACWSVENVAKEAADRIYPDNFNLLPEAWLRLNLLAIKALQKLEFSNCLLLSYEDMVQEQAQTFSRIFQFLQLNNKHEAVERKISAQKIAYRNTTTIGNPLTKWKSQLTEEEQEFLQAFISDNKETMEKLKRAFIFG